MAHSATPSAPRFDHRTDTGPVLGLAGRTPALSWIVPSADPDYAQHRYELEITRESGTRRFMVHTADQVLVPWPDEPLVSREKIAVRVRVAQNEWSGWSEPTTAEAGLFDESDWTAHFISPIEKGGLRQAAPELRGVIAVPAGVVSARLYATAHGIYSPRLNGEPVDDGVLAPGWTAYQHRLRYQVYDVTDLVVEGENSLDVVLGNGWWRGRFGFLGERAIYGDRLALLAQLEVTTADGSIHVLDTDEQWAVRSTGILSDDIYDGQTTDLRIDDSSPFDGAVEQVDADLTRLVGADGPPMRETEEIAAVSVWTTPSGSTLVDFGQNVVGWVRITAENGRAGDEVIVRHAEVLEAGELGTGPLRSARATDTYFLSGAPSEILEPSLTFHGFRYAEITGLRDIRAEDVHAVVIGTDLRRTGWFDSSDPMLNRLHENVVWGMRGNFLDVPTDCPQRDERLGWTGDIQAFAPTATFLFDSAGFLTSWLADLAAEQAPDGSVPHVVPDILRTELTSAPAAAWGDAATVVPWVLWQRTGDTGILRQQYASMRAWVDKVTSLAGDDLIWRGGFQYGDWLDPTAPHDDAAEAKADPDVVATAYFAHSARLVADTARELGHAGDADRYSDLADAVSDSFCREFVTPAGRILSDAQTVYVLALEWDLLPARSRAAAGARLADLVRTGAFRIATGFVGTPLITDALANAGYPELAFRLLQQTKAPSWLYPITMGATTVWERWDSLLPDGTINPSGMTSFNHYALGSVIDWMHRRLAGLAPREPGYRLIGVNPLPPAHLDRASTRHLTPYGEAAVGWRRGDGTLTLDVTVPVGASAEVTLPGQSSPLLVRHGHHSWTVIDDEQSRTVPRTVRDLIDDPKRWAEFEGTVLRAELAPSDIRLARLLGPFLDRPIEDLLAAVWTKGWPSPAALESLADVLAPLRSSSSTPPAAPMTRPGEPR
ncbi:family 78 glycoside hydrolase catalytic domain [Rathayibacter festucae]|uniref:alpha-L-rhamnosidase n=1 Tax=Rathayibacter festucae TaxID=110937 RepID=A0ABX6GZ70_9MICO|nr:alpha-L-rhamnosidase [Rathayibacter festucae]QHC62821.1 family 78 glycoside hydrolase catalytic domain [Rathayibacter festucae]